MSKAKKILCALCLPFPYTTFAKSGSVNYSWGADALATMHDFVVTMMLYVQYICCAIAGVYVIVSVCQIYIKMNTGEDGITKETMREFISNLDIPADAKASLMELTPATYIGKAVELARRC